MEVSGSVQNPGSMGTYTRVSGVVRFDRPVYQNVDKNARSYLYFCEKCKKWRTGPDYKSTSIARGDEITSKSYDVWEPEDADQVGFTKGWYDKQSDGSWKSNPAIKVSCKTRGVQPLLR